MFNNVFGPAGLLRQLGCIVFLATHSSRYTQYSKNPTCLIQVCARANYCLVRQLPQADIIIVLGEDGQVLEQGSYPQLQSQPAGYIQTNGIHAKRIKDVEKENDNSNPPLEYPEVTAGPLSNPSPTDGNRQIADLAVYKYYFSALGWLRLSILLFCLVVYSGMTGIRCMLTPSWIFYGGIRLTFIQMYGSTFGRPVMITALIHAWDTGLEYMEHCL